MKFQNFNILENEFAYISPYSEFLISRLHAMDIHNKKICDYGAGTGVIGICATKYIPASITSIEIDNSAFSVLTKNYCNNTIDCTIQLLFLNNAAQNNITFDVILCNPASLPHEAAKVNNFCDGGKLGLDMIIEVLDFSYTYLNDSGHIYILVTSILPRSILIEKLTKLGFHYKVSASTLIPFREHYDNIVDWIEKKKEIYPEMYYIAIDNVLYEEVLLFDIFK